MSEELKNQLIYEIADELIQKFDMEISQEILTIINKHLYNYDVIEKQTSLIPLDSKTERILKMYIGTKKNGAYRYFNLYAPFFLLFI